MTPFNSHISLSSLYFLSLNWGILDSVWDFCIVLWKVRLTHFTITASSCVIDFRQFNARKNIWSLSLTSWISQLIKCHPFASLEPNILTGLNFLFDLQVINLLWARQETRLSQFLKTLAITESWTSMACPVNRTTELTPHSAERSNDLYWPVVTKHSFLVSWTV